MPALSPRKSEVEYRYKLFAKAYMGKALRNACQAAILAGYSQKSARVEGPKLLQTPAVRRLLRLEAERRARKMEVGPEQVIAELGKLAFSNVADFTDDSGRFVGMDVLPKDASAAIQELTIDEERRSDGRSSAKRKRKTAESTTITRTRVKLANKIAALELLGRHWNLYGDNEGGSQTAVKVIVVNSPRPGVDALVEAKRIAALPDEIVDAGESPDVRTEWDGEGGPDVGPPVRDAAATEGDEPAD
jgi:phage terminase small subunit